MVRPLRPLLAVVVVIAGAGCAALDGDEQATFSDSGSAIVQFAPDDRADVRFPEVVQNIEGKPLKLADRAQGKVVVLNAWASWCGPCIKEAGALREADERFAEAEVTFIAVNIRDNPADAQAFVRQHDVGYPNVSDPSGSQLNQLNAKLTFGVPTTAIVTPDGQLAALVKGEVSTATVAALVEDVLAEG